MTGRNRSADESPWIMQGMTQKRTPKYPATKISGIATVLAILGASVVGEFHVLWPAVNFVLLVTGGGLFLEIRHSRRQGYASPQE